MRQWRRAAVDPRPPLDHASGELRAKWAHVALFWGSPCFCLETWPEVGVTPGLAGGLEPGKARVEPGADDSQRRGHQGVAPRGGPDEPQNGEENRPEDEPVEESTSTRLRRARASKTPRPVRRVVRPGFGAKKARRRPAWWWQGGQRMTASRQRPAADAPPPCAGGEEPDAPAVPPRGGAFGAAGACRSRSAAVAQVASIS